MNATEDDQPVGEAPELPWGHLEPEESVKIARAAKLLTDNGYAVVKLPEPQQIDDYEDGSWWDASDYEIGVLNKYPDEVEIVYRGSPSEPITGTNAYDLGIALIAASKIVARA